MLEECNVLYALRLQPVLSKCMDIPPALERHVGGRRYTVDKLRKCRSVKVSRLFILSLSRSPMVPIPNVT